MFRRNKLATAVMAVVSATFGGSVGAQEANVEEPMLEEVVVSGIRSSLQAGADMKRNSDFVQDSIVAEDIGKFPDANVAESLQRISGVSIDRSGGEGQKVTVRGFGPEFNTVLVNGRRMASDSEGRAFNFDLLSSELIGGADVFKTSSVALQEGGIGSTINLKTQRPLNIGEFTAVASAKGLYDDKSDDTSPNLFGFISNTFADDTIGVLVSASYQERTSTQDSSVTAFSPDSTRYDTLTLAAEDLSRFADGQGNGPGDYTYQRQHNFVRTVEDRTRTGLTGVFQFRPSDTVTLTLDALYSDFEIETDAISRISHRDPSALHNLQADGNNVITSYDMIQGPMNVFQARNRPAFASQYGFNVEWFATESLTASFDVSMSESENDAAGDNYYVVVRASDHLQRVDNSQGTDAPLMRNFALTSRPDANCLTTSADENGDGNVDQLDFAAYTSGAELLAADVSDQCSWFAQREGSTFKDDIVEAKVDFEWQLDWGALTKVSFGALTSKQEKSKFDAHSTDSVFYLEGRVPLPASLFSSENRSDFLSAADGDFASDSIQFDPEAVLSYLESPEALALRDELNGLAPGTSAAAFANGYAAIHDPTRSYDVEENIFSAYISATFDTEVASLPLTVNAGLRYTSTKVDSTGAAPEFLDFAPSATRNDTLLVTTGDPTPVTADADYSHVLPSINARLDISDTIIARAAFSKTLTRPEMTMLNPAAVSAQELRLASLEATAGNPDLEPFEADNIDLSLEWYYSDSGHLTLGFFHKVVDGFIVSGVEREGITVPTPNSLGTITEDRSNIDGNTIFLDITRPRNLEKTSVSGLEVAFQHIFDYLPKPFNHFGVTANLTFVDAEDEFDVNTLDNNIALPGLGDSQNFAFFYDDGRIEARIAYNNREEFFTRFQGVEPWFTEDYDQLDARVAWNITDTMQVFVEGTNLTDSFTRNHGRYNSQFLQLDSTGPRYTAGVRASF